jgi:hypothetical protein
MANLSSRSCLRFDSDAVHPVPVCWGKSRLPAHRLLWPALILLGIAWPSRGFAQQEAQPVNPGTHQGSVSPDPSRSSDNPDALVHGMEERMAERRNAERQKSLVADTDKLLALAQALKVEVDKTDKDTLSIDVVKRAEQIEKLARSVKEKMRGN